MGPGGGRGAGELEGAGLDTVVRAQHYLGREPLLERLEILGAMIVQVAFDLDKSIMATRRCSVRALNFSSSITLE